MSLWEVPPSTVRELGLTVQIRLRALHPLRKKGDKMASSLLSTTPEHLLARVTKNTLYWLSGKGNTLCGG